MESEKKPSFDIEGFEAFRRRATDSSLSSFEKIGFPDSYRAGKAQVILEDITAKLPALGQHGKRILDVGAGCSDLPVALMRYCAERKHSLVLVDSTEMLAALPDQPTATKVAGAFPTCKDAIVHLHEQYDAILVYSVAQYVFVEGSLWGFIDSLAELLAEGGHLLIGDIPNASMRKRFLSSASGERYHREHFSETPRPEITFNQLEPNMIDDAVVMSILMRMRAAGLNAYVVPQGPDLPMANRREDILIHRP